MAKIGLIGCGMWGRNLARNLAQLGVLVAVADRNSKAADEFASAFNVTAMAVDSLVEQKSIDGIVIATSAPSHDKLKTQRRASEIAHPLSMVPVGVLGRILPVSHNNSVTPLYHCVAAPLDTAQQ